MATAPKVQIWTPGTDGSPASIWAPGGIYNPPIPPIPPITTVCGVPYIEDNAIFALDPGNGFSYNGVSNTIFNLITEPADGFTSASYNYYLGKNGIPGNNRTPEFVGTPGDCVGYFRPSTISGLPYEFVQVNIGTPFTKGMHKLGAKYTIEIWFKQTSVLVSSGTLPMFDNGTTDQGGPVSSRGMFYGDTGVYGTPSTVAINTLRVRRANEAGGDALYRIGSAQLTLNEMTMIAVSLDSTGTDPSFFYKNGAYDPSAGQNIWNGFYVTPLSTDPVLQPTLFGRPDAVEGGCTPHCAFYFIRVYNTNLTKARLDTNWNSLKTRFGAS